ncbi:MAG: type II toxin-antitoxin system VapC family toxin [Calditrichia bacterium]
MIRYGIDTNVLIRFIVQDDPEQSKRATDFLKNHCSEEAPGFISMVVMCEIVWVLRRAYGYSKSNIINVLETILRTSELMVEEPQIAWEALHRFKTGSADFSDFIIGTINKSAGCEQTATFDQQAGQSDLFRLI